MANGVKARPETIFTSLAAIHAASEKREKARKEGEISTQNLRNSNLFRALLGATGGDKLEILG